MRLNKKAFTLTELLIALGVIGVLAAILLPVISNLLPDQNAIMAKRAYYATQNIVSEMINDADCYPDMSRSKNKVLKRIGFDDGYKYPNCELWKADTSDDSEDYYKEGEGRPVGYSVGDPKEYYADVKFMDYFRSLLDLAGNSNDEFNAGAHSVIAFATKDGMHWYFRPNYGDLGFNASGNRICRDSNNPSGKKCVPESYITIFVDVNGSAGPNKIQPRDLTGETGYDTSFLLKGTKDQTEGIRKERGFSSTYDIIEMHVHADGAIEIMSEWVKKAVDAQHGPMSDNNIYETDYVGS